MANNKEQFLEDREMEDLFAAFGAVHASEAAKSRTLEALFADLPEQDDSNQKIGAQDIQASQEQGQSLECAKEAENAAEQIRVLPGQGRKPVLKTRLRAIRTVAVAACLALACFGGVAYATPAAQVTVQTNAGSVELDVNRFGITIGVHPQSDEAEKLVEEADLGNRNYETSIDAILDAVGDPTEHEVAILVEARDEKMQQEMEERSKHSLENRGISRVEEREPTSDEAPWPPDGSENAAVHTMEETSPAEQDPQANRGEAGEQRPEDAEAGSPEAIEKDASLEAGETVEQEAKARSDEGMRGDGLPNGASGTQEEPAGPAERMEDAAGKPDEGGQPFPMTYMDGESPQADRR